MLRKISINARMLALTGLMAVFSGLCLYVFLNGIRSVEQIGIESSVNSMNTGEERKLQVATHAMAVAVGQALQGVPEEEQGDVIRKLVNPIRFEEDKSGYFFVYKGTTVITVPTNEKLVGKDLGELKDKNGVRLVYELSKQSADGGGFVKYIWPKPGKGDQPKLSYAEMIPGTDMWIGTGVYLDNVEEERLALTKHIDNVTSNYIWGIASGVIGFFAIVILPLCLLINRSIIKPLEVSVEAAEMVAEGDLTRTYHIRYKDLPALVNATLKDMTENLAGIVGQVQDGASTVGEGSREVSQSAADLSHGANSQAASVEEV